MILITGATGFLGGSVLSALLGRTDVRAPLVLVRARDRREGLQRIRETLAGFDTPASLIERLGEHNILLGDLNDVAAFSDDPRLDQVSHVLNCAAVTSFGKNPLIWPINVDGTFALAKRMAESATLERFLHVGTAMACGPSARSPVRESWQFAPADQHLVPYTASKAAIEEKLRAELPDLPLVIARPSIVVGHTRLGCKPSSSIFWVFRLGQMLERFTCALDEKIDVIPVDYCADALIALLLKKELKHDIYHISAGQDASCTFENIEIALADALDQPSIRGNYRQILADDFSELAQEFERRIGPCNRRLLLRALRLYSGFAALNFVFDNSRLCAEGVPAAPPFSSYAGLCAQTTHHLSIEEQMRWDFK